MRIPTSLARDAFIVDNADRVVIDVCEDDRRVVKISIKLDVEEPAK